MEAAFEIDKPFFLVGAERSGTTMLRLMLSHHPQVAWCNEFEYAVDLMPPNSGFPDLNTYYEWLSTCRVYLGTGFKLDRSLDYPHLIKSFLSQKREQESKPIVGATVHRHFDRLLRICPEARFIHIVRDARDVARSCIGMGWAGNVWTGVERWIEAEQLWQVLKQNLSPDRWIELTYEDLIIEPVATLTRICEFIGVNYDPAMLTYETDTTYDAPNPKYIYQWQRKLSEREIRLVESRVAPMLTNRGYKLSGLPLLEVDPLMKRQLRLHDWAGRVRSRIRNNGLPLFLADYASRKLGMKRWQKRVQLQINEVINARRK